MTSVDDLLAALQVTRESLPHDAVDEYRSRLDGVEQQVLTALRTSRDEGAVLAVIAKAREDGSTQIQNCLTSLDELIASAGNHW
ncbi:hypothetical protein H7X46_23500 [Pseudonocardia sp. C8]|uniref:Uncharacterized protein n=1 Tax=Saccharopolyspora cebuensis TaxID=418759 RepID=A0ABV4CN57_9PSEU|nr:hypothetical protein [Pseudonocardia sp. C8]MBC3194025.1 hypothetical protein [Pseudonocardia sp. C8]